MICTSIQCRLGCGQIWAAPPDPHRPNEPGWERRCKAVPFTFSEARMRPIPTTICLPFQSQIEFGGRFHPIHARL
eukprot:290252-Rhodomonas_salina.1